jgi:hypothetical protein
MTIGHSGVSAFGAVSDAPFQRLARRVGFSSSLALETDGAYWIVEMSLAAPFSRTCRDRRRGTNAKNAVTVV